MRIIVWAIALCGLLLTSCSQDDWNDTHQVTKPGVRFRLYNLDYQDEKQTRSAIESDANYDRVEYYIMDEDGYPVENIRTAFLPATSEIVAEGLAEGDYMLYVLGIKGDETLDQATIHTLNQSSDTWLTFPEDLQRSLQAEYFYSRTPFRVTVEQTADGIYETVSLEKKIVQRRIIGKLDFDFIYHNPYVRTAVTAATVQLENAYFCTSFSADSVFSGTTDGIVAQLEVKDIPTSYFMPTVSGRELSGTLNMESRRYTGEKIRQVYTFSQIVEPNKKGQIEMEILHPDDRLGTLFVTSFAYQEGNHAKILQDDEPKTVYANSSLRSFNTSRPLQVKVTDEGKLHLRFYSPRDLGHVTIKAQIPEITNEYIDFAYFDTIPGFADIYLDVPCKDKSVIYASESGRLIEITPQDAINWSNVSFKIESPEEYWDKLQKIIHGWNISFGLYGGDPDLPNGGPSGNWMGIRPVHCREVVAVMLNFTFMIDIPEHEQILKDNADRLYDDNKQLVSPEKVLAQMRQERTLVVGLIYPGYGVLGLGGGSVWGVYQQAYLQHYWNSYSCNLMFHELGHCMGYGHSSSFTYGPWAEELMNNFYVNNIHMFPIDSPTYLNSSQNPHIYK